MPDFRLISGQYVFTRKIGDKDTLLPIRLRMVAPYHLLLPGGQVCNLNSPGSIGPYANMLWDAMAYALLGEVLQEAEEWSQKP